MSLQTLNLVLIPIWVQTWPNTLYKVTWHTNRVLDMEPTCGVHLSSIFLNFVTWDQYVSSWTVMALSANASLWTGSEFYSSNKKKIKYRYIPHVGFMFNVKAAWHVSV